MLVEPCLRYADQQNYPVIAKQEDNANNGSNYKIE